MVSKWWTSEKKKSHHPYIDSGGLFSAGAEWNHLSGGRVNLSLPDGPAGITMKVTLVARPRNFLEKRSILSKWLWIKVPIKIPFLTGMNIHLPAILMFTRGIRFWHTASMISCRLNPMYTSWVLAVDSRDRFPFQATTNAAWPVICSGLSQCTISELV